MFLYTTILILILNSDMSKSRYVGLNENEEQLYRTAYDTPSYHDDCDDEDLHTENLELVKDGLWALKAKVKELKAFNKALVANLLTTKLKLKELLVNKVLEKKEKFEAFKKDKQIKYQLQDPPYSQYPAIPHGYDPYIGM
ncbi:uncharacterized protein LOC123720367 [Pieris brassicae]|uniref:uncharacterized protein LOC123720367 n=1 Tax=Pieris brassicae TaxID=7116 RepID=UPI001E66103E|nr:uncharacterized protein LOC123720367 [Pieris brassicae]